MQFHQQRLVRTLRHPQGKIAHFYVSLKIDNKKIWFTHAVMIIRKIMTSHSFGNECLRQLEFFIEIIVTYFE